MPDGSRQPAPARARSRSFSQVDGASIRRSSASPLAAPRTRIIVPERDDERHDPEPVMRTPLTRPQTAAAAIAGERGGERAGVRRAAAARSRRS